MEFKGLLVFPQNPDMEYVLEEDAIRCYPPDSEYADVYPIESDAPEWVDKDADLEELTINGRRFITATTIIADNRRVYAAWPLVVQMDRLVEEDTHVLRADELRVGHVVVTKRTWGGFEGRWVTVGTITESEPFTGRCARPGAPLMSVTVNHQRLFTWDADAPIRIVGQPPATGMDTLRSLLRF